MYPFRRRGGIRPAPTRRRRGASPPRGRRSASTSSSPGPSIPSRSSCAASSRAHSAPISGVDSGWNWSPSEAPRTNAAGPGRRPARPPRRRAAGRSGRSGSAARAPAGSARDRSSRPRSSRSPAAPSAPPRRRRRAPAPGRRSRGRAPAPRASRPRRRNSISASTQAGAPSAPGVCSEPRLAIHPYSPGVGGSGSRQVLWTSCSIPRRSSQSPRIAGGLSSPCWRIRPARRSEGHRTEPSVGAQPGGYRAADVRGRPTWGALARPARGRRASCSSWSPGSPPGWRCATARRSGAAPRTAAVEAAARAERGRRDDRRPDARADERAAADAQADRPPAG